jgi:Domain of unknown function (DUF4276)
LSRLRVAPIVEGHGEDLAIRILLQRLWGEVLGGEYVEVLKPIRSHRTKMVKSPDLERALGLAALKLRESQSSDPALVLIMLDADEDLACVLGPDLLSRARALRADIDISCVVATVEYETWFVAAAHSLSEFLDLTSGPAPDAPESSRSGKAWIQRRFRGIKYSPTVDQPSMTRQMDLRQARQRSPSFDKLCRELEKRMVEAAAS